MSSSTFYRLNSLNRIVETGGAWDTFAQDNNAPEVAGFAVIGTSIWAYIHTEALQSYMNALFVACRVTGESIALPYRCDAPDYPRLFTMTISPLRKRGLLVTHDSVTLNIPDTAPNCVPLTSFHAREKCSVCCSFKVSERWIDPFAQPFEGDFPKGLGLCPKCKANAAATVATIYNKARA